MTKKMIANKMMDRLAEEIRVNGPHSKSVKNIIAAARVSDPSLYRDMLTLKELVCNYRDDCRYEEETKDGHSTGHQ